ncbi:MAG: aminoglycoside phosphotransferase family protein [Chloroflexi bacterium]|nr:aminoglycoside phosphotransferase family protein [Chloroflexota bacterium]
MKGPEKADEEALRACLERVVRDRFGSQTELVDIRRKRSDYASSYGADVITGRLSGGSELKVFLKDFSSYHHPGDEAKQRCKRELWVYRDLLPAAHLGTAGYYGSVWDAPRGRLWLLIELVDGVPLRQCDLEHWVAAAGWLGRLHGYSARHAERLAAADFLVHHDAAFFRSTAERAVRAVSWFFADLADQVARLVARYDPIVEVMVAQPPGLAHGSYRPKNILVGTDAEPPRICPIDWELAALGSPLSDLAFIADGFDPPTIDRLLGAYRAAAIEQNVPLPGREEMVRVVHCFRLHKTMKSLSESWDRRFPARVVAELVDTAETIVRAVE